MLYLDLKYLHFIQHKLEKFERKKDNVFLSRCPICGDSLTNKNKKRFYIYSWKNELRVRCHNCGYSSSFGSFLKDFDPFNYEQYRVELFKEKYGSSFSDKKKTTDIQYTNKVEEKIKDINKIEKIFHEICVPLGSCPETNKAVQYCKSRRIHKFLFSRLYYVDNTVKFNQLSDDINLEYGDERLVIPFFDKQNKLIGLTARSLSPTTKLRYLSIKINEVTQIFGLDKVDPTRTIYVVEGPIDSLFIPNCIAVTGTAFGKIETVLSELNIAKDQVVLVVDNQPRNKDVVKIIENLISRGYNIVIWDISDEVGKDINAMIVDGGMSPKEVFQSIKRCTYRGLEAMVKFVQWKRC